MCSTHPLSFSAYTLYNRRCNASLNLKFAFAYCYFVKGKLKNAFLFSFKLLQIFKKFFSTSSNFSSRVIANSYFNTTLTKQMKDWEFYRTPHSRITIQFISNML